MKAKEAEKQAFAAMDAGQEERKSSFYGAVPLV